MKIYRDLIQGSGDWFKVRLGIPTASQFGRILTPKGDMVSTTTQKYKTYICKLIAERLLHESMEDNIAYTEWVRRGVHEEPNAAAAFQLINDVELEKIGFITTDDGRVGCSPDRLVKNANQCVEIKCPSPGKQIEYHVFGPGDDYRQQVQGQLWIGEFDINHFYSYHPSMPGLHIRVKPEPLFRDNLKTAIGYFCDDLDYKTEIAKSRGAYVIAREVQTPFDNMYPEETAPEPIQLIVPD